MITLGANPKTKTSQGLTPLHIIFDCENCCEYITSDVVKLLIKNGADPNAQNKNGYTALHYAVLKGKVEVIKTLIRCKADVNAKSIKGETALHLASGYGFIQQRNEKSLCFQTSAEMVRILLKNGSEPNAVDTKGDCTPLFYAASSGNDIVVEILLDHGADPTIQGTVGSALSVAIAYEDTKIQKILRKVQRGLAKQCAHCNEKGSLLCSRSKLVSYCSKKCQEAGWTEHKKVCKRLKNSPQNPKIIKKKRAYARKKKNKEKEVKVCGRCSKQGTLQKCGNCKAIFYCSRECQKLDWKEHKKVCRK